MAMAVAELSTPLGRAGLLAAPPSCGSRRPPLLWVPAQRYAHPPLGPSAALRPPSSGSQRSATALENFGAADGTDLTPCCTCSMAIQALRHATLFKRLAVAVLPYWLLLALIPKV